MSGTPLGVSGPYKGLTPFEDSELDALLFFGREREREIVVANLIASRLTVLYGPSGVGKSSLLRAGVARALRELTERPLVVVFSSWTEDPAAGLAEAVDPSADSLQAALAAVGERDVYLILDQAEEYFLYHGDGESAFEDQLAAVVTEPLRVNVLLSLREDALAKLDRFKGRIPNLFGNYLRLDRLDRAAGRSAIVGPVERFNDLGGDGRVELEPALVEAVLDEVGTGRIAAGLGGQGAIDDGAPVGIEAPYLQLVMQRLWEVERASGSTRLRRESLERLGGARRIVAEHLERAMATLTADEQEIAASLFNHLVTPSGTKIAHGIGDLAGYTGVSEGELRPVLAALVERRIVRPLSEDGGEERFEIFHDVLAGEVLAWRTAHSARRAVERARAEARRRHRRLAVVSSLALAGLLAMVAVAVYALSQRSEARHQTAAARAAQRAANEQAGIARVQKTEAERQATAARKAQREAAEQARIARANAKRATTQAAVARSAQREAARQARIAEDQRQQAERQARIAGVQRRKANEQATLATSRKKEAEKQERIALRQEEKAQREALLARARELTETAEARLVVDPLQSVRLAVRAAQLEPTSSRIEDVLRRSVVASHVRAILPGDGHEPVRTSAFNPDGSLVVVADGHGGARVYRARSGSLVRTLEKKVFVSAAVFSPATRLIATADGDGRARLWTEDGVLVRALPQGGPVTSVAFSDDGKLLITASLDHTARVWRTGTGEPVDVLQHDARVTSASLSSDGARAVTVSGPPPGQIGPIQARLFDVPSGRLVSVLNERGITSADFSPDGRLVATTSTDRSARLWDARTGDQVRVLPQPDGQVLGASFSRDGKRLVAGGKGGTAYVWDVATGQRLLILVGPTNFVESGSFSPDGRFIVVASLDRTARIYASDSGLQVAVLAGHTEGVTGASFSPDGAAVITASVDGTARIWDPGTKDQLELLGRHDGAVNAASFSPNGRLAVSASDDGTARIWLVRRRRELQVLRHDGPVHDASFSTDGSLVVTASEDETARIWSTATGRALRIFRHSGPVTTASFSTDGRLVVTASEDGTARIWSTATGRALRILPHDGPVRAAVFSPDGTLVGTGSGDVARLWSVSAGVVVQTLRGHRGTVARIAFSPDGTLLATASGDGTARIWRTSTGALVHQLLGHKEALTDVEFSQDGWLVVTSSLDRDARIWDVATGRQLHLLRGHFSSVQSASFSPDGRWVVTSGQFAAGLWDASTGRLFSVSGSVTDQFLHGHTRMLTAASFSADGTTILTASADGTVRTFRCDLCAGVRELITLARTRVTSLEANLTPAERKRYLG